MEKGRIIDKERLEALAWLIEFANLNLDELRPGDRAKLEVEVDEYLFPKEELDRMRQLLWGKHAEQMASDPKALPPLTSDAWYTKRPERGTEVHWAEIQNAQKAVQETLQGLSEMHPDPKKGIHVADGQGTMWEGEVVVVMDWGKGKNFSLQWLPTMGRQRDYIEVKLYRLLDGLPSSSLQKCPGCRRFFLNPSRRRKRFCSPRCMWRVHAEDRRKSDPEGYRAKQREIMRKKYETKKREALGANVKVGRKPRKES